MFVLSAFAQYNEGYRVLGDKAFANKDYYQAAINYKKTLGLIKPKAVVPYYSKRSTRKLNAETGSYLYFQIAESYRLYQNYTEAGNWYGKVLAGNNALQYPLARLWYGICLRADRDLDSAATQLQQFVDVYKGDNKYIAIAKKEIENCRFAEQQYRSGTLAKVTKMSSPWNAEGGDYALTITGNTYWFTSTRSAGEGATHLNRMYALPANSMQPVLIDFGDKNEEYGTPSVDGSGTKMYITKWYKKDTRTVCEIYLSLYSGGKWQVPQKLNDNVNVEGFNSMQPCVTVDGKHLYFSSNKPGGRGGDDIWMCDLDTGGNPLNSEDLGGIINTPDDEQAPFFDDAGQRLVYSSKGFTGLGGFDLFESRLTGENVWAQPENLGYPINSSKDDMYYMPDRTDKSKFYISSDRESECCLSLFQGSVTNIIIKGVIADCVTGKPIVGVAITLLDSATNNTAQKTETDSAGVYTFKVNNYRHYKITLSKSGYFTKISPLVEVKNLIKDTLTNSDFCLAKIEVNKPIVIKNILYDFNKATLRSASKAALDTIIILLKQNPSIKIELSSHTDSIGKDEANMRLSQARAQSCVDYMVAAGIDKSRIIAKGYGKTNPIAPNSNPDGTDDPAGRQLNRRTEFTVLKSE